MKDNEIALSSQSLMRSFHWPHRENFVSKDIHDFSLDLFERIRPNLPRNLQYLVDNFFGEIEFGFSFKPNEKSTDILSELFLNVSLGNTLIHLLDALFKEKEITNDSNIKTAGAVFLTQRIKVPPVILTIQLGRFFFRAITWYIFEML